MSNPFNADEIFEIAEQIEVNGGQFYRRAAEIFDDDTTKTMLIELAEMEDDHQLAFRRIREELKTREQDAQAYDPYDEVVQYLRVFSVGHVFKSDEDVRELFTGRESKEWVLLTAIGLEKESIVFYVGLRDLVPEEFGRDKIDAIIREEKKHIVILTHELTAVKNLAQSAEPDPGP